MTAISFYNHTRKLFANGEVDLSALKLMLVNGYTFSGADTDVDDIDGYEASGGGWPVGGEPITGAAITIVNTNESMLDAVDLDVEAVGATIGPADGAILYQDVSGLRLPLFFVDFEGTEQALAGAPFRVSWNTSGIARWIN